ncbi:NADPH quinone reductase MdaB [Arachidicoccus ginsenosidimutans]|uniref:NAD(P)H-dependent oxidoreductase n=1 Tax=Arachidicoccus sp. BS20 TaxID=1850526 RepID=UPI0007F076F4|nr:NAD(P)H-dependent oxidoreductase [Arachidicoccus sp. BS20]ANI88225.1 NADPH quinone reductase MdaB [Arachidicoccus sp. BS20]
MKKIFIINAGQNFGHSGGRFNNTITDETLAFLSNWENVVIKQTIISNGYNPEEEVQKFVWADVVIYHTPIWWFQLPHGFKKYIDEVFTAGHKKGIYHSDGRSADNPKIGYGTGGMLHGRSYMLTTSWNAPQTAFSLPGEFFNLHSVDEGPLFGFHRMNAFTGMQSLKSFHFHDVEKNANIPRDMKAYRHHLEEVFETVLKDIVV